MSVYLTDLHLILSKLLPKYEILTFQNVYVDLLKNTPYEIALC
jgi:hypothetical protein